MYTIVIAFVLRSHRGQPAPHLPGAFEETDDTEMQGKPSSASQIATHLLRPRGIDLSCRHFAKQTSHFRPSDYSLRNATSIDLYT